MSSEAGPQRQLPAGRQFTLLCLIGLLPSALLLLGCGSDPEGPPTVPVQGVLLIDDKPAFGAQVIFNPADGQDFDQRGTRPTGTVQEDGRFRLTTYQTDDGAPIGSYVVTIYWAESPDSLEPSPDRLQGRYLNPSQSKLKFDVQDSQTDPIRLVIPTK